LVCALEPQTRIAVLKSKI